MSASLVRDAAGRWYVPMPCVDCGNGTSAFGLDEYFMVHAEVWAATGLGVGGGLLCIGCVEARIGRRLTAADFTGAPVNDWRRPGWHGSPRLLDRLTAGAGVVSP